MSKQERLARLLDYMRVDPNEAIKSFDYQGDGTLRDRDCVWDLDKGHVMSESESRKAEFRELASVILAKLREAPDE